MKLSISNIGWEAGRDEEVYALMKRYGFTGLEIAPTRIFPERPYEMLAEAAAWSTALSRKYGFVIPSMQSIWFGRKERLFGTVEERETLAAYTRKAVDFAAAVGCDNIVFGCPRNRVTARETDLALGISFFKEMGDYAAQKGVKIGMEANPPLYHTNYINDTLSALRLVKQVDSEGFRLNLDVGAMLCNQEDVSLLTGNVRLISHVHISEPELRAIEKRAFHAALKGVLADEGYQGYVSIEMGKSDELSVLEEAMEYVGSVFQ